MVYKYFVIHEWMVQFLKLSGLDLFVYAVIFGLCQYGENHIFHGNNSMLVQCTGATRNGVQKSLKKLIEKNYILVKERNYKNQIIKSYKINFEILNIKKEDYFKNL